MANKRIKTALISVYHKTGLDPIVEELKRLGVTIYSTGGTQKYIESLGAKVETVEAQTGYPSILGGRVKTLHPKVFGGILARREEAHLRELGKYNIPELDLVIVDLYPFEDTVANTNDEAAIIEKIDIGGVSLIRAAAKNYKDVVIVPSQAEYATLTDLLKAQEGETSLEDRKKLALRAFAVTSNYDVAIYKYFGREDAEADFRASVNQKQVLRYGENPHQKGAFYGDLEAMFDNLGGKAVSYNNLVDIDAAVGLMRELKEADPTFAVLKHTNACGVATRPSVSEAWDAALAGDPVSAFGGILITNTTVDLATAEKINKLFYEVLIARDFVPDALALLQSKKKRILLRIKSFDAQPQTYKSLLNGVIVHDTDVKIESADDLKVATEKAPTADQVDDLLFANIVAKHLKSNTITLVKDQQLLAMGCGQTSRVDALKQAITKAKHFGFELEGAVMASDAFFPFPDCVEIAHEAGIKAVIQPGGSIKDNLSIEACNKNGMAMVMTGTRHFRH
ncbi:MAG: bifunctional phosphoribosylaminoimidazolecarboxamide formyltransferase/IMP cyclohydrolase [Bacteroidota bacterium]